MSIRTVSIAGHNDGTPPTSSSQKAASFFGEEPQRARDYSYSCASSASPFRSFLSNARDGSWRCLQVMSPELADLRKEYLKIVTRVVLLTIVLMWTCLPMYVSSAMIYSSQHPTLRTTQLLGLAGVLRKAVPQPRRLGRRSRRVAARDDGQADVSGDIRAGVDWVDARGRGRRRG